MHGVAHDPVPASSAATTLNLTQTPVLSLPTIQASCTRGCVQALDGFSLCLWQLGEADGALAGSNVFALLHCLSVEPDQLLRRSIITAVGALSHPGKLYIKGNDMGNEGIKALCGALSERETSFRVLDAGNNRQAIPSCTLSTTSLPGRNMCLLSPGISEFFFHCEMDVSEMKQTFWD